MNVFFLDQSGQLGGAELSLSDLAQHYRDRCTVGVFVPGPFPDHLRQLNISVRVLANNAVHAQKQSGILQMLGAAVQLVPLVFTTYRYALQHDAVYANTQKALVVGAIVSAIGRKPLVYHLRDIVSPEHFSRWNRSIIVALANRAKLIIANSRASQHAFVSAGGQVARTQVVYNGFHLNKYDLSPEVRTQLRHQLGVDDSFVVGHFSRFSPWKGQHVLVEALKNCPDNVIVLMVGSALFGEDRYVDQVRTQIDELGLGDRVKFLGFRSDIPELMTACDAIVHTSIAAEPFGRVIVEGMLCGRPVIAAAAGGALEIVEHGKNWLANPPRRCEGLNRSNLICELQSTYCIGGFCTWKGER